MSKKERELRKKGLTDAEIEEYMSNTDQKKQEVLLPPGGRLRCLPVYRWRLSLSR